MWTLFAQTREETYSNLDSELSLIITLDFDGDDSETSA